MERLVMKAAERVEVRQWAGGPSGGREKGKNKGEWRVGEKKPEKKPEISQRAHSAAAGG